MRRLRYTALSGVRLPSLTSQELCATMVREVMDTGRMNIFISHAPCGEAERKEYI